MVKGMRLMALSLRQMAAWAAVLVALTALPQVPLPFALTWPVAYMIATACWKRWREA